MIRKGCSTLARKWAFSPSQSDPEICPLESLEVLCVGQASWHSELSFAVLGIATLLDADVACIAVDEAFITVKPVWSAAVFNSGSLAAVLSTEWTRPDVGLTPLWQCIPKNHCLPLATECISGSLSLRLFLVELGAFMIVASRIVPSLSIAPLSLSIWFTPSRISSAIRSSSSRWRKLRIVVSSGNCPSIDSIPAKRRKQGVSISISSIRGSERVNHCSSRWIRSITSNGIGGRPPFCWRLVINGFNQGQKRLPGNRDLHLIQEVLATRPLFGVDLFVVREAKLEGADMRSSPRARTGLILAGFSEIPQVLLEAKHL